MAKNEADASTSFAAVERSMSDRLLELPEGPFEELFRELHVLVDIRLKMAGAGLPVVGGVSHAAGEEDKFVGIDRWEDAILGVAPDHAETVDEHPDEEVGLTQIFPIWSLHEPAFDESRQGLHGVGRP